MPAELACSAILFDLDGVLVFSAASVHRSWSAWAAARGIPLADVLAAARGQRSVDTIRAVAPALDAVAEAARLEAEQALDVADVTAGPGAGALLATLADGDWAIVTSGTAHLAKARLRAAGLPVPEVLVTAADVGNGKPDPAGYLLAARRLGRAAEDCVVIEDAAAGVEAGKCAGMRVVGLTNGDGATHLAAADAIARSCADVTVSGTKPLLVTVREEHGVTMVDVGTATDFDPSPELVELATELALGAARIWHVSSTSTGGGVAELLWSSIAEQRSLGLPVQWLIADAPPEFFQLTKRLHHGLHGNGTGPFEPADTLLYRTVTTRSAAQLTAYVRPGDVVLLHDPQTIGSAPHLIEAGARVAWRCHIGTRAAGPVVTDTWEFLRPYVSSVPHCVFTALDFAPKYLPAARKSVIMPSIDPNSPKNRDLTPDQRRDLLAGIGLTAPATTEDSIGYVVQDGLLPLDAPVVTQVSRWDPLKDMTGVLRTFADRVAPRSDAHLLLVGPDPADIPDDPEGAGVFADVCLIRTELPPDIRARVHLVVLSLRDKAANGLVVNALQRHSTVVVQKSLAEGFGLTITEAMWKSRPIVASAVGGIVTQLTDRVHGLLVDPLDYPAFGDRVHELLAKPEYAATLGAAAHRRCADEFLTDRELADQLRLYASVAHE